MPGYRVRGKGSEFTADFLHGLWDAFISFGKQPYEAYKSKHGIAPKQFASALFRLQRQGWVRVTSVGSEKFLELTKEGQLEMLLRQSSIPHKETWDGKWRMVVFDIPEEAKSQRDKLRRLLYNHGYKKLQASVFIYPHPLNRTAIQYLQTVGLMPYIRILRVDEMDNDADLRKQFQLPTRA